MSHESEPFYVKRWHSPEYVESWLGNRIREAEQHPLRKKVVSLLPFEAEAPIRVLDLGAGAGPLSLEVLSNYPKAQVVCHDFSGTILQHARQQLSQFSGRVTFIESDLREALWLKDIKGSFDAVVASFVMHAVGTRIDAIYGELFRLLNGGGCFLACDTIAPPGPMTRRVYVKARLVAHPGAAKPEAEMKKSLDELERELRQRGGRNDLLTERVGSKPVGDYTLVEHLEWLGRAGFDEVDCLWKDTHLAIIGGFKHGTGE